MGMLINGADSSSNHHSPTTAPATNGTRSPVRCFVPSFNEHRNPPRRNHPRRDGAHRNNNYGYHRGFHYFPTLQMEPFQGNPVFPHSSGFSVKVAEIPLPNAIVRQIDYYFSDANLVNDEFLRSSMNEQGWVPIDLIASFNKIKSLTKDIDLILNSLRNSSIVEVQDKKLRRRDVWMNWLSPARNDSASILPQMRMLQ